jgi:hypothetical protein
VSTSHWSDEVGMLKGLGCIGRMRRRVSPGASRRRLFLVHFPLLRSLNSLGGLRGAVCVCPLLLFGEVCGGWAFFLVSFLQGCVYGEDLWKMCKVSS